MTTIFYTPGRLTTDSRGTDMQADVVLSDEMQKIRRFGDPKHPHDGELALSFKGDQIFLAAASGNSSSSRELIDNLARYGDGTIDIYNQAKQAFRTNLGTPWCILMLVGEKHLHLLEVDSGKTGSPFLKYEQRSLKEPYAIGSGKMVVTFLHQMFRVPPPLAVAATGLIDDCTGGVIVDCCRSVHGKSKEVRWVETLHHHLDPADLLDNLTDHFSTWNVGEFPFVLTRQPRKRNATKYIPVKHTTTIKGVAEKAKAKEAKKT